MGKNKLRKFAEINSFSNVVQPQAHHTLTHFELKGKWKEAFFHNYNPIVLEIGCGKGEYTTGMAKAFPEKNFIGIDIKGDRIWKGAKDALDEGSLNAAFLRIQAQNLVAFFDKEEVSGIWLTFPDPQPRKVRERKRLTSPWFLNKYRQILAPKSPIHLKTDNKGLFNYTLQVIKAENHHIVECSDNLYNDEHIEEPFIKSIQTYYEKMFLTKGLPIHYLKFCLNENP
ncbi:MAG: tRNA (guanosine(46)-N7)-methyltransferase TrmB [Bacteroidia bacterium]|nr:MAG: tRNA (guanosine(46)-N7)-methyltransferase TrmB [Bacteroidia bacterium]